MQLGPPQTTGAAAAWWEAGISYKMVEVGRDLWLHLIQSSAQAGTPTAGGPGQSRWLLTVSRRETPQQEFQNA